VTHDAQPPRRLHLYAAASALACAAGVAVAARVSTEALLGAAFASAAAAAALPLVAWGTPRSTNALLGGFVGGFFARMILVAAGLLYSGARGALAAQYAVAFFAVYAATQAVEVAYVVNSSRSRRVEERLRW
jgi:hypothetical protein